MIGIIQAFQALTPEELAVVFIVGLLSFILGIALG
jgi:hypothetical protein